MDLAGKKILLGITGSIAAYKSAELCRALIKKGAEVKVIMTPNAVDFISPLTLSTLSQNQVLFDVHDGKQWNHHVDLGLWADAMLIAPATAHTIASLSQGLCNNLLLAVYLSARCPVFIAPAMDVDMWKHPSTQKNIIELRQIGHEIIDPHSGFLASGLNGQGRLAEPEYIISYLEQKLASTQRWQGKKILITSGPTKEAIDPVRFISNHSTGKMGKEIAENLEKEGAEIIFITGPTTILPTLSKSQIIKVESAEEMYQAALAHYPQVDIAIFTAAVADYTPQKKQIQKIKKEQDLLQLDLIKTKDIAYEMGKIKKTNQINIGFALETDNIIENAKKKLIRKNFNFIVMNQANEEGAGFGFDTNIIRILKSDQRLEEYPLMSKKEVAQIISKNIYDLL